MSGPRTLTALRYLQPLREGGSLPAVVETDGGLYVVKFRGAGQGARALIAEIIVAGIAGELGLPVPELVQVNLPDGFGAEQDETEIRELLDRSVGGNVGLRYLDGAFNFDPAAAGDLINGTFASEVVWLDGFLTNPDRTPRNPNLMVWDRRPWLIDHGSALYAHHSWDRVDADRTRTPFPMIANHVLLPVADDLAGADERLAARLTEDRLAAVAARVPEELLMDRHAKGSFASPEEARDRYVGYLAARIASPRAFAAEAQRAWKRRLASPVRRLEVRR